MNTIDKIFIINLKDRSDRWEKCIEQLENYNITNYERFDAIRPNLSEINPIQYSKNNLKRSKEYIKGAMGCKLSHLEIIKIAKIRNYQNILILEDDFLLCNNFINKLEKNLNKINNKIDYNMLYLGFSIVYHNPFENTQIKYIKKLINTHTTHAYIMNKSFYDIAIKNIENCFCEIDVCYSNLQKKYNIYGIYPCLITQRESYSDILNKNVNYKKYINFEN